MAAVSHSELPLSSLQNTPEPWLWLQLSDSQQQQEPFRSPSLGQLPKALSSLRYARFPSTVQGCCCLHT